jgi:hypothetical protein
MDKSSEPPRRSDRIEMAIEVEATGLDVQGRTFDEMAVTSSISRHGAVVALKSKLGPGQEFTLRSLKNNKDADVRVLGLIDIKGNRHVYGVALVDPAVDLWGVHFPVLNGEEEPLTRLVLQCGTCREREVVHFNEIEMQVFETNQEIRRFCRGCSGTTVWKQPKKDSFEVIKQEFQLNEEPLVPTPIAAAIKRKYERIATQASACIRQPDGSDEIVKCENISRGGLCFHSSNMYLEGSRIEVAVPCSPGAENIFVPAQIVHCHRIGQAFRVGAVYIRSSDLVRSYRGTSTVVE